MRNLFLISLLLLMIQSSWGQGTHFYNLSMEEAIERAKVENKYVFIDFYTTWCGPCKMMEKQLFPLKEIGDYLNSKFVCIKQNAGDGAEGENSAKRFGVKAYPTFVVLNGDGELLHMFAGGVLDLSFINKVEDSFNPQKAFGLLKKRYDNGERDVKFVASYLNALQNTYTENNIGKLVDDFYKTLSDEEKICSECLFIFDQYAPIGSEKEFFLTTHHKRFREVVGGDVINEILKRKYVAFYGQIILGYNNQISQKDLEVVGEKLVSLNLPLNHMYELLQKAAIVKMTGVGERELFNRIEELAADVEKSDLNAYLYYAIIGLKNYFDDEQKKILLSLVSSESIKGYIERSIN